MNRAVICPKCSQELEVRAGKFAHDTLAAHLRREHKL